MHVFGCIAFLAICVLSAYSMPNLSIGHKNNIYEELVATARSPLIDIRTLTPDELVCADAYNNRTQQNNNLLTSQTNKCFENSNNTLIADLNNTNVIIQSIKNDLQAVQDVLANATNTNDTTIFLTSVTTNNDRNMELLDSANAQALLLLSQLAINEIEIDYTRSACVSIAVSQSKHNQTVALDDYNGCLGAIQTSTMSKRLHGNIPKETPINEAPIELPVKDEPAVIKPINEPLDEQVADLGDV